MSSLNMHTSLRTNKRKSFSNFNKMENFKEGKNIQVQFDEKATLHQLKEIKEKLTLENKKSLRRNRFFYWLVNYYLLYSFYKILTKKRAVFYNSPFFTNSYMLFKVLLQSLLLRL